MPSISELNNSTSLRSVRERKRPGAKTSRGPAFIFGNKAGAEPKNDIELRLVGQKLRNISWKHYQFGNTIE